MNISGVNSSSSSILISWLPPSAEDQNGIIIGYNVSYFSVSGGDVTNLSTPETSVDITDLMFYTVYNVSVSAFTSMGTGPSGYVTVRTDSSGIIE